MNKDRRLANLFFICFSLLSLLLLLLPISAFVRGARALAAFTVLPAIKWSDSSARYLAGIPANIAALLQTEEENRRLRAENRDLELYKTRLGAALEEGTRLKETMGLTGDWSWSGSWAHVLERNSERWYSTVLIDKGERDGMSLHAPAVAVYKGKVGVAGKIIEVRPSASKLLLVTDPMFSVTASALGFDALAEGQGRLLMRLNYLPPEISVPQGTPLVTAQSSTVFPPGILLGTVVKVYPAQNFTPFVYADVLPAVPPGELKEVFVITGKKVRK